MALTFTLKTEINNENQEIKLLECSTNNDKQNNPVNIPLNHDTQDEFVNNKSAAPGSLKDGNSGCDIVNNNNSINNDQILDINLTETIPVKEILKRVYPKNYKILKNQKTNQQMTPIIATYLFPAKIKTMTQNQNIQLYILK